MAHEASSRLETNHHRPWQVSQRRTEDCLAPQASFLDYPAFIRLEQPIGERRLQFSRVLRLIFRPLRMECLVPHEPPQHYVGSRVLNAVCISCASVKDWSCLHAGAFVFIWTPCHFFISSPSTWLTSRCCLMTGSPVNWSETISRAYIEPQPPEMSCT